MSRSDLKSLSKFVHRLWCGCQWYCDYFVVGFDWYMQDVLMDLKSARLSHVRPAGLSSDHETYVMLL